MDVLVPLFLSSFCLLFSASLILLVLFRKPEGAVKPWHLLVWAAAFLGAGFGLVEYALWISGENLFAIAFAPNVPLLSFFTVWFLFLAWLLERQGKRTVWLALLAALAALVTAAVLCMDCLRF